jgi:hypothetical protein
MASPIIRVELGLNLDNDPNAARLDDPIKGILDGPIYTLGGVKFYDISDRVISVSVNRGKSQALDRNDSGVISIVANNQDRLFDPLYEQSRFYGALVPRREVKVYANDIPVFFGFIDDFDIQYEPGVQSICRIDASDAFSSLNKARLPDYVPTELLPGPRIIELLDLPEVNWNPDARDIDTGITELLDNEITENTGLLEYLQLVSDSEFGNLFISKDGKITFRGQSEVSNLLDFVISDDDSVVNAIPFTDINVVYGSEFLFNRVVISNADFIPEEVIAEDLDSQRFYGVLTYARDNLLTTNPTDLESLAGFLLGRFSQPQYRFESVTHILEDLTEEQQNKLLDVEIGDYVEIRFEPSNVPPAIEQLCRVIGIAHNWQLGQNSIVYSLERIDLPYFKLSDEVFGRLSEGNILK